MKLNLFLMTGFLFPIASIAQSFDSVRFIFHSDTKIPFSEPDVKVQAKPLEVQGLSCKADLIIQPNDVIATLDVDDYGLKYRSVRIAKGDILVTQSKVKVSGPVKSGCDVLNKEKKRVGSCNEIDLFIERTKFVDDESSRLSRRYLDHMRSLEKEWLLTQDQLSRAGRLWWVREGNETEQYAAELRQFLKLIKERKEKVEAEERERISLVRRKFYADHGYVAYHTIRYEYSFLIDREKSTNRLIESLTCMSNRVLVSAPSDASDSEIWLAMSHEGKVGVDAFAKGIQSSQVTVDQMGNL